MVNKIKKLSLKLCFFCFVFVESLCNLKMDKTKVLMVNGNLMKVKVLQIGAFCNTFDLH